MIEKQSYSIPGPEVKTSLPPAEPFNETNSPPYNCPTCSQPFMRKRKDKKYCSKPCAKAASRNATRDSRKIADSGEARRRHETRSGRLTSLTDALYETPPAYRAEFLERLIEEGRKNSDLRKSLTLSHLLGSWMRGTAGRIGISHSLDHFCQAVYGLRSFEVLNPKTILPAANNLAFPASYFGPDAPPIYEDGSLKVRPCPIATKSVKSPSTLYKEP